MGIRNQKKKMRNKTIAVIADKSTGVVKSIETEIIVSDNKSQNLLRWECREAMKKLINRKKYIIVSINVYFYD